MSIGFKRVNFKEIIDASDLEQILVETAKELGYRVEVKEEVIDRYELGSLKKSSEYNGTLIKLKKFHVAMMDVRFDKRPFWFGSFTVYHGLPFGLGSEKSADKYLENVDGKYMSLTCGKILKVSRN